jgi:3-deoxy-D-manno-octulosonic-acid transferase
VITGPAVHNFEEVYREMVGAGAARVVRDAGELAAALGAWLSDEAAAAAAGRAGRAVVDANRGATGRSVDALLELSDRGVAG